MASVLHYKEAANLFSSDFDNANEGNIEFLQQFKSFGKVGQYELAEFRDALIEAGIPTRHTASPKPA